MTDEPLTVIAESYRTLADTQRLLAHTQVQMARTQHFTHLLLAFALVELGLSLLGMGWLVWWHMAH